MEQHSRSNKPAGVSTEQGKSTSVCDGGHEQLVNKISSLEDAISSQQKAIEVQQRAFRRNNFIIVGVEEDNDDDRETVSTLFKEKLALQDISLSRVRRIGHASQQRPRILLVSAKSYEDKEKVMKSKHHLKGTRIFINDDLTPQQRTERRELGDE